MKVYSPNPNYSGVRLNVQFRDGVGKTADEDKLKWFEAHGYGMGKPVEEVTEEVEVEGMTGDFTPKRRNKKSEVEEPTD